MAEENLLKMAEQKFQSAAEKIAKDLIATCYKEQQTNADRIRAMSDEELATDLLDMFEEICEDGVPSKEWMMHWLKQPAEENDG